METPQQRKAKQTEIPPITDVFSHNQWLLNMCWYLIIHFLNKKNESERERVRNVRVLNVSIELGTSELTNKRVFGCVCAP